MCILCVRVKINKRSFEPFCAWICVCVFGGWDETPVPSTITTWRMSELQLGSKTSCFAVWVTRSCQGNETSDPHKPQDLTGLVNPSSDRGRCSRRWTSNTTSSSRSAVPPSEDQHSYPSHSRRSGHRQCLHPSNNTSIDPAHCRRSGHGQCLHPSNNTSIDPAHSRRSGHRQCLHPSTATTV